MRIRPNSRTLQLAIASVTMLASFLAATLTAAANQSSIIILSPNAGSSFETAPVQLTVRLDNVSDANRFRAYLNHRDITSKFARATRTACSLTPCDLIAEVYPADGLQRGTNEFLAQLSGFGGEAARVKRTFAVTGPKANAGLDVQEKVGRRIHLDGGGSQSSRALTHMWTLMRKPQGSRTELVNPTSAAASFTPDVNGTYLAQLVVHDGHFESEPSVLNADVATAEVLNTVRTRVITGDGTAASDYAVVVGNTTYPANGASVNGVHVLVFNRKSLDLISDKTYDTTGPTTAATLISDLGGVEPGQLVILSTLKSVGAGFCPTQPNNAPCPVSGVLATLGATNEFGQIHDPSFVFNMIGIKGIKQGGAWQNGTSDLSGYFTLDVQTNYTFVNTDYVKFEVFPSTEASPFGTMIIGGKTYTGSGNFGVGGLHLLVLDRAAPTQAPLFERIYYSDNGYKDLQDNQTLASYLNNNAQEGNLVLITSFGQQNIGALRSSDLPKAMAKLGANPYVVAQLDLGATYSFIGAISSGDPFAQPFNAVEASSLLTPDAARRAYKGRAWPGKTWKLVRACLVWYQPLDSHPLRCAVDRVAAADPVASVYRRIPAGLFMDQPDRNLR